MNFLQPIINFLGFSRYAIVFILCIVEGPVVMMSSGFLYRLGQFNIIPLYLSLMAGDFAADIIWYIVGRFGAKPLINRFGNFFNITPEIIAKIEKRFRTFQDKILFISKITMGFGFALATLIVAGMLKVPFKRYAVLNLIGGFIWTAFLLLIGYFFGNVYALIPESLKAVFVVCSLGLVAFGLWLLNRYLTKIEI